MHPLGCWTAGRQAAKWRRVADAGEPSRDDRPSRVSRVTTLLIPLSPAHRACLPGRAAAPSQCSPGPTVSTALRPWSGPSTFTAPATDTTDSSHTDRGCRQTRQSSGRRLPSPPPRWMIPRARSYLAEWCRSHSSKRCCPCTTPSFTWTTTLLSSSLTGPSSPSSTAIRIRTTPKCISQTYIRPHADCFVSQDLLLSAVEQHGYSYQAATTSQPLPERCHHLSRHMGSRE